MNASIQKVFVISIGVIVVLFLLLDGGAMTEATISSGMAANGASIGNSWIWIIPTLLIFGLGFLLAWLVLGEDEVSGPGNLRITGKDYDDPHQARK